jgi:hypothetical protein
MAVSSPGQVSSIVKATPPAEVVARPGTAVEARFAFTLSKGFHVNSDAPLEDYLIPLRLTWTGGPIEARETRFPEPHLETYSFSDKPLSVFTGDFEVRVRFAVPPSAARGRFEQTGKLRYQACNDKACYPPRTLDVKLPVTIE